MNRVVTTFKTVKPDSYDTFVKIYEENENIMPCQLYVDSTTGSIYFIEQERKPLRGQRRELSLFEDYCSGGIENSIDF